MRKLLHDPFIDSLDTSGQQLGVKVKGQHKKAEPVLTVLFPCLNEASTLPLCIDEVCEALADHPELSYEIIVADNTSSDGSADIARRRGARVVEVPERGYGSALKAGINAARSPYVLFADADGTYPLSLAPELYRQTTQSGAVLGIASRLRGNIQPGAMPWLHRWIGTPCLTRLLNYLYRGCISDCGAGLRCVNRKWFLETPHHSTGMEFASEMLIRVWKSKQSIIEIANGYRKGPPTRQPHLHTWRDGMRHLMFILSESPATFERLGMSACVAGSIAQTIATWHGPLKIGIFDVFGLHTQALALLLSVLGVQIYFLGVLLFERVHDVPTRFTRWLLRLSEQQLFFSLLGACGVGLCVVFGTVAIWWNSHFSGISFERVLLGSVHLSIILASMSLGLFAAHMNRTWKSHTKGTQPGSS